MSIVQFDRESKASDVVAALDDDGAALVQDQIDRTIVDAVRKELLACLESERSQEPHSTLDTNLVLAKSHTAVELIGHPRVMAVADAILLRHCSSYQLGTTYATRILPNEAAKELRADAAVYPIRIPGVEWQISAWWALDDLTMDNGAPTLIPGSHRGDKMRLPDENDMVQVSMPKGSLLLSMGWTLRGRGANRSDASSTVLVSRYSLGWLQPEVNYVLSVADETIQTYPEHVRRLLGYGSYENGRLGWFPRDVR